ncbi:MAG: glycosyltransferase [Candidatus Diapherotrites archaeon]|uniref:Glycosyltransferase n=1 Tax=Candidatus Iainarchaeum sp. TaxID=3101447 RepID=A0A8T4C7K1_9ARCH|nr:glycosyltransferase [Candidatus Diapherotrites archaeon]
MKTTPNTSQNEVVVLMPARNESRNLPSAIYAVNTSQDVDAKTHVIVGANACTDNTVDVLETLKLKHKNLDYVIESVPGKPRALNALMDRAEKTRKLGTSDVVLFLDADAQVQESTIADLTMMLRRNKKLNAVSANDVAAIPNSESVLDHLLFGISEISLSSLALRDRKASCMAVRANVVRGVRFPEHVIADDLWLQMYLGIDTVETHPTASVTVQSPKTFFRFAESRVKHLMGLYQLEEFFPHSHVREHFPTGTHDHAEALLRDAELQDEFVRLPGVYQLASVLALPIHAALKAAAFVGYRMSPQMKNTAKPIPTITESRSRRRTRHAANA